MNQVGFRGIELGDLIAKARRFEVDVESPLNVPGVELFGGANVEDNDLIILVEKIRGSVGVHVFDSGFRLLGRFGNRRLGLGRFADRSFGRLAGNPGQ